MSLVLYMLFLAAGNFRCFAIKSTANWKTLRETLRSSDIYFKVSERYLNEATKQYYNVGQIINSKNYFSIYCLDLVTQERPRPLRAVTNSRAKYQASKTTRLASTPSPLILFTSWMARLILSFSFSL